MSFLLCFKPRLAGESHANKGSHDQAQTFRTISNKKHITHSKPCKRKPQHPRVPVHQTHLDLINSFQQPLTSAQHAALARLHALFALPKQSLALELFSPIIADLDTVLFNDLLSPRVIVEWALMTRQIRGISLPYDFSRSGISMVYIRLNKLLFKRESKEEIWGTVLHEMLHAYLDLTSNWAGLKVPHHGVLFERSCCAMVERLGLRGFEVRHVV